MSSTPAVTTEAGYRANASSALISANCCNEGVGRCILAHRPLNGHHACKQSNGERHDEQKPRANMPSLDGHAILLSKTSRLQDQRVILRYFIMLVNDSDNSL